MRLLSSIRVGLDWLYRLSGVLAAFCLIAILLLIVAQMVARWVGDVFPGAPNYAGYFMAAASFLAFANALNRGSHIRVSIVLNAVSPRVKQLMEIWCFGLGVIVIGYFTYYAYWFTFWSWKFNEVSQAQDASPLWIPQSVMVIGGGILFIALLDNFLHVIFTGNHRMQRDLVDEGHTE